MVKKLVIGLLAGTICGLFGTGGGMILVPAYIYILKIVFVIFILYYSFRMLFL